MPVIKSQLVKTREKHMSGEADIIGHCEMMAFPNNNPLIDWKFNW